MLLIAGLAFGLFSDNGSGSPSVRLLGTPPATRTQAPATTRSPSELTPVLPTATSAVPGGETPGAETPGAETPGAETPATGDTPSPIQTATPTLEIAPTAAATATPTPQVNDVANYVDAANQYTPGLVTQIDYVVGNVNAPNITSADWRNFTIEAAQNIQGLAASLGSLAAPACVSAEHGSLVAAANQASASAGEIIAAINANNANAATTAGGGLAAARDSINGAVGAVSNAVANSC